MGNRGCITVERTFACYIAKGPGFKSMSLATFIEIKKQLT